MENAYKIVIHEMRELHLLSKYIYI